MVRIRKLGKLRKINKEMKGIKDKIQSDQKYKK